MDDGIQCWLLSDDSIYTRQGAGRVAVSCVELREIDGVRVVVLYPYLPEGGNGHAKAFQLAEEIVRSVE